MHFRQLSVDGQPWEYFIGKGKAVLKGPDGVKKVVDLCALTGRSPEVLERGHYKRTSDAWITPQNVTDYIRKLGGQYVSPSKT